MSTSNGSKDDGEFGASGDLPARPALGVSDIGERRSGFSVHRSPPAFQSNAERDTCFRLGGNKKTAVPAGDERCLGPWYHPTSSHEDARCAFPHGAGARCGDPVTGVAWPVGPRRRLLGRSTVRDEAQRSFSPVRATPHLSNRGSLRLRFRVLVLLDALALSDCDYANKRHRILSIPLGGTSSKPGSSSRRQSHGGEGRRSTRCLIR